MRSCWAGNGRAYAFAIGLVPNFAGILALLNDAFDSAFFDVPSVQWVARNLRFADALAVFLIPNHGMAILVVGADFGGDALALAIVEVPEVVGGTCLLNAYAISGKCVELFPLVVTFLHLKSTGAVQVQIIITSPDKLSLPTNDKQTGNTVTTRSENTVSDCNFVFYFCLSKISSNLMLGCFKA